MASLIRKYIHILANLKRGLHSIYHHVGREHLPLYLAEFDYRYSERDRSDGARSMGGIENQKAEQTALRRAETEAAMMLDSVGGCTTLMKKEVRPTGIEPATSAASNLQALSAELRARWKY
jgi:hypothetical protein